MNIFGYNNTTIIENINEFLSKQEWIHNQLLLDWLIAGGTIGSTVVAVGIAAYSFKIGRENEKKGGLRYVFQLLDDNAHRNARRLITNLYNEKKDARKEKILRLMGIKEEDIKRKEAIIKESEEIVKDDFDQIGSLITNKEIPKKDFIRIYWYEVLRCWYVLEQDIKSIRETLNDNYHMKNFEKLKDISYKYSKKKIKIHDIKELIKKDIVIYPNIKIDDKVYESDKIEIRVKSDESLDVKTFNSDTIYLVDENNNKIQDYTTKIKWNEELSSIIIKVEDRQQPSKYKQVYLVLSIKIKDQYGISLKEEIRSKI